MNTRTHRTAGPPAGTLHRRLRHLAVAGLAIAVTAALPLPGTASIASAAPTLPSLQLSYGPPSGTVARGHLLAFNDFHGAVEAPTGSGAVVNGTPAGGVEYLATALKERRQAALAQGQPSITVGAGDLIGATPLISAAFHDEPTIELMNTVGLDLSAVGNHEFDEGVSELQRIQRGGCHPTDGCQTGHRYRGADFPYLAANVIDKRTHLPIGLPATVKEIQGQPVGFVGMTLKDTKTIVNPAGVASVDFADEVSTANTAAKVLRLLGVKALVLVVHQGGAQSGPVRGIDDCNGFSGPIAAVVAGLEPEYGAVVSGHTHQFYNCSLPNRAGTPIAVTSAGANGQLVTDLAVSIDRHTGRFTGVTAQNHIALNGVGDGSGGWQRDPAGNFVRDPARADAAAKAVADHYRTAIDPVANRVVGKVAGDITRDAQPSGESPLGDVIADAQLAYTRGNGAQLALMNPGGIRASLSYGFSPGGEPAGAITYGEAFTVQPFNNLVVTQTFTGGQLKAVLEQQFAGQSGQTVTRILQVSDSLRYTYDVSRALGDRVSGLTLGGTPVDPAASYQVTTNDFLANGGDGFTTLRDGTGRTTAPGFDVDALTACLGAGAPVAPGPANRITAR